MLKLKKISAILACFLSIAIFATGCGGDDDDSSAEVVTNVITEADGDEDGGTTTASVQLETEVVTDADGNAVTGVGGNPITEMVTEKPAETGTLSEEDIQAVMTATVTQATTIVNSSVDNTTRYAYNTLDDDEKALYDAILGAASTMSPKIFGTDNLSMEKWAKVFGMVYNQEPQLFWLSSKIKIGRLYFNETDTEQIAAMQKEIDTTVNQLVSEANKKSSTFDKLKVFHDYLVLNSTFEKDDAAGSYNQSIYNAFSGGTSSQGNIQCSGYAKAMQYLCDQVGIDCIVITGTNSEGASHAWNKVKVEGEWYNLDCTWDDPILTTPVYNYIRYNNFLVPDSWINEKTHFNINSVTLNSGGTFSYFTPPTATATAQNYFIKNNLVYSDFDSADAALKKALEDTASAGGTVAEIMVDSKDVYNKLVSDLKGYQDYIKGKNSSVKGVADNCNEYMLIVQLDIKYN
ncbi:MAG: hypothetical protein LUI05_03900 [Oscillospiraceae bacterium]|nr:hypothetical protein [Oscillospiraceae bacterium]